MHGTVHDFSVHIGTVHDLLFTVLFCGTVQKKFYFCILSMIIWLWSYHFNSFIFLVYDVGFIHVFRLNSCLEKTWNWLEQVWKLKKSGFGI